MKTDEERNCCQHGKQSILGAGSHVIGSHHNNPQDPEAGQYPGKLLVVLNEIFRIQFLLH